VALLAVGYAAEKQKLSTKINNLIRPRKKLEEIASWETYGKR
jgi:hypothetical protein